MHACLQAVNGGAHRCLSRDAFCGQDLAGQGAALHREEAAIELHALELEGFGPYRCA